MTQQYQQVRRRIVELSMRHSIPVRDFTELFSFEVKGDAQQFYQVCAGALWSWRREAAAAGGLHTVCTAARRQRPCMLWARYLGSTSSN